VVAQPNTPVVKKRAVTRQTRLPSLEQWCMGLLQI